MDILAKLKNLKEHLETLTADDGAFVNEMLTLLENGQLPSRHQIVRIEEMQEPNAAVPKDPLDSEIWNQGVVTVMFIPPDKGIWRYMPLERILWLLCKRALHFSPLCVMDDKSEGHVPPPALEEIKKAFPPDVADALAPVMVQQRNTDACINCWYMDDLEAPEMWRKFAPRNGVAVRSTVGKLASSLQNADTPVRIIPVSYRPEEEPEFLREAEYGNLFIKRSKYEDEKEIRALVYRPNVGGGVDIPVDVGVLIERLMLSPELGDRAVPIFKESIERLGFHGRIEKSGVKIR